MVQVEAEGIDIFVKVSYLLPTGNGIFFLLYSLLVLVCKMHLSHHLNQCKRLAGKQGNVFFFF